MCFFEAALPKSCKIWKMSFRTSCLVTSVQHNSVDFCQYVTMPNIISRDVLCHLWLVWAHCCHGHQHLPQRTGSGMSRGQQPLMWALLPIVWRYKRYSCDEWREQMRRYIWRAYLATFMFVHKRVSCTRYHKWSTRICTSAHAFSIGILRSGEVSGSWETPRMIVYVFKWEKTLPLTTHFSFTKNLLVSKILQKILNRKFK